MVLASASSTNLRVVVTGLGTVNPLGHNCEATWTGILNSQVNAKAVSRFDASSFQPNFAFCVDDHYKSKFSALLNANHLLQREAEFGLIAAVECLQIAKLDPVTLDAIVLGCGKSSDDFEWFLRAVAGNDEGDVKGFLKHPSETAHRIAQHFKTSAHQRTIHTACASSAQAIGEAYDLIATGQCNRVLAGGADSMIEPIQFAKLSLLGTLSKKTNPKNAYIPFSANRDGFILGEGASILLLESEASALNRGAEIIAELKGYGITQSAQRITDLDEKGSGPRNAILASAANAQVDLKKIDYINAHGTGTVQNDAIEAAIFSDFCPQAFVSSTKSLTGHLIAGAGAMEALICVLAIKYQTLPPSVKGLVHDPSFEVRLTPTEKTACTIDHALSNSIGFGGTNVSLIFARCGTHGM